MEKEVGVSWRPWQNSLAIIFNILLIPRGNTPWELLQVISKYPTSPFSPIKGRLKFTVLSVSRTGAWANQTRSFSG